YLGIEGLNELLDEMENIEWIDLKKMKNTVKVKNVSIQSGNGEIKADVKNLALMTSSFDFLLYHILETTIKITWLIAGAGIAAVLMFFSFIFYLRIRK
ncbi:MAG: hypothetical protein L0I93_04105, partial [Atopostipes suicloacalis]|nr:hypothetical protein [Atopostipes suicloacalis]